MALRAYAAAVGLALLSVPVSGETAPPNAVLKPGPALAVPAGALPAPAPKKADDPVLPLRIPGYELRVLDVRKSVRFNVDGAWVEASVPVFLYYPSGAKDRAQAAALLRQAYQDLIALGHEREWTAADLERVLAGLNASLVLLENR